MTVHTLPGIGLTGGWDRGADYKDGMDANLRIISALLGGGVESRTVGLPGSPADGVVYIVPAPDNRIAIRDAGAWAYVPPVTGLELWVKDTSTRARWNGSAWVTVTYGGAVAVKNEGAALTGAAASLNFVGSAVDATVDGSGNVTVTVSGGGGGGSSTLVGITAAHLAADFTVTVGAWRSPTSWAIDHDNLSTYSTGSDFIVPTGANFCRVKMFTAWTGAGAVVYQHAFDTTDGTTYAGDIRDRNFEAFATLSGPMVACTPGRIIRFEYNSGSGTGGLAGTSGTTFGKPTRVEIEWYSGWPV